MGEVGVVSTNEDVPWVMNRLQPKPRRTTGRFVLPSSVVIPGARCG